MHSHGKLLAIASLTMFAGCFAYYDYDHFDNGTSSSSGAGGSGGVGGGESASSSSGSSGGNGMAGGAGGVGGGPICGPVPICPINSTCNLTGPCVDIDWAKRFGTPGKTQEGNAVAIDSTGKIVIGGNYTDEAVGFPNGGLQVPAMVGKNGFVAVLSDTDGSAIGVASQGNSDVKAVATNTANDVVAASQDGDPNGVFYVTVRRWSNLAGVVSMPAAESVAVIGATPTAITTDDSNNVYVIGDALNAGGTVTCADQNPMQKTFQKGIFVIKYKGDDLTCLWAQQFTTSSPCHGAAITAKNGNDVWVTGHYGNTLGTPGNPLDGTGGSPDMFVIKMDKATGNTGLEQYGFAGLVPPSGPDGQIEPQAIDTDSSGNVYVAGKVTGPTVLDNALISGRSGAFMAKIVPTGATLTLSAVVLAGDETPNVNTGARATGIVSVDNSVYVSGTFAGSITLAPQAKPFPAPNADPGIPGQNTPFLAILDHTQFTLLSFEAFPGNNESFANAGVYLTGRDSQSVALAGRWINNLDFSRGVPNSPNLLKLEPNPGGANNADIFVAKLRPNP